MGENTWQQVQRRMERGNRETMERDNFLRSLAVKGKGDSSWREMTMELSFLFFAFYLLKEWDPLSCTVFHSQN